MKKIDILGRKDEVVSREPLLVDVKEVARLLNVCERTIRTLTKSGELPVVKLASRILYSVEDLVEFVRQRSTRETSGKNEQINFMPCTTYLTPYHPVEWFIPPRAGLEVNYWDKLQSAVGYGR